MWVRPKNGVYSVYRVPGFGVSDSLTVTHAMNFFFGTCFVYLPLLMDFPYGYASIPIDTFLVG